MEKDQRRIPVGTLVLHLHARTLRAFSIGVLEEQRGQGIGEKLVAHTCDLALARGCEKVSLEARVKNEEVVNWYKKLGFVPTKLMPDYYAPGEDAQRLVYTVSRPRTDDAISNVIVVDQPSTWRLTIDGARVISSKDYISAPEYQSGKSLRVFNLCNSYRYQSIGYYVSLLASAREHRAIPSVTTIRDFRNLSVIRSIANDVDELIQDELAKIKESRFVLDIYFGQTTCSAFRVLANKLYQLFETPLLQVHFGKTDRWLIQKVNPLSLRKIAASDHEHVQRFAGNYFLKKRFRKPRLKNYKYDLAILYNPTEPNPPSCPAALRNFKAAANKVGFYVDLITREDYEDICEYDALFIRETTSVNNHTYQFSRRAYAEGLVVVDDPWSILRCSNKIYLHERMKQNRILVPLTTVLVKDVFDESRARKLAYPMVLKQPDSAFSIGVTKVASAGELIESATRLFKKSDLIIAQEFLPSEYDWRVGILDQTPLFACKYYMAKDHWQIYNWQVSRGNESGDSETVPIDRVPEQVLKTAVKAAALMGDGFYGVDLKLVGNRVYLIEVNDNPNVDAEIEDGVLKDELYLRVMRSMLGNIERSRDTARFVAVEPALNETGR